MAAAVGLRNWIQKCAKVETLSPLRVTADNNLKKIQFSPRKAARQKKEHEISSNISGPPPLPGGRSLSRTCNRIQTSVARKTNNYPRERSRALEKNTHTPPQGSRHPYHIHNSLHVRRWRLRCCLHMCGAVVCPRRKPAISASLISLIKNVSSKPIHFNDLPPIRSLRSGKTTHTHDDFSLSALRTHTHTNLVNLRSLPPNQPGATHSK